MNVYKNLIKTYTKCYHLSNKPIFNKQLHYLIFQRTFVNVNNFKHQKYTKRKGYWRSKLYCSSYNPLDTTKFEEITDLYPYSQNQPLSNSDTARSVLYPNNNDSKITQLGRCASVEEVFDFVRKNACDLNYKYLTQIVLVLSDLQNMFVYHLDEVTDVKKEFFKNLLNHQEFFTVINNIQKQLGTYDIMFLSYTAIFLNKLGLSEESHLIQDMAIKLRDHLLNKEFSLNMSTRFLRVIFQENSVRPYFTAIDIIPKVFKEINSVKSVQEMDDLTSCLNVLHLVVTEKDLSRYTDKVNEFIENKVLTADDYQVLLNILTFLNVNKWRHRNSLLISKCILLMEKTIELMSVEELERLYYIYFKNKEPGIVLNTIQRACAKTLHELEDTQKQRDAQLKLFASLIYFTSPGHRSHFRNNLPKYLSEKETLNSLISLRKIYSYLKISDIKLCDHFWKKACQLLKEEKDDDKILKLYDNYITFSLDTPGYRHYVFEHHIMMIIQNRFLDGSLTLFPYRFFSAFSFALVFCRNSKLMNGLFESFKTLKNQINDNNLLKISEALNLLRQKKPTLSKEQIKVIRNILNEATERIYLSNEDCTANTILIKAAIVRNDYENELIDEILLSFKKVNHMSSKLLDNLCFDLFAPKALIPEILNKCTEYLVQYKDNIIGFNADRLLHMCYYLNYYPINADKFFQAVTDLIIRDQERLSGFSFLQSALSLCFFNQLPKTFVKQIFNVEFLDKLDIELANCYFRDVYPQRVRNVLMQLNRAVCLEYPEYNVPWFHQKYIDEFQKTYPLDDVGTVFHRRVKDYLTGIIDKRSISENVITPYGYQINFVVHLNKDNNPTVDINDPYNVKVAVLLKEDSAFTRFYIHLKGKHELEKRHLEILGYKVKVIKFNEWVNLLYAKERIDFIQEVVFS